MNIGNLDQLLAGMKDFSEVLREYHQLLQAEGFTEEEAMKIVIELQRYAFFKN